MAPLRLNLREPRLRLAAALLFLFGAFVASLAAYQSLLATNSSASPIAAMRGF